MEFTIVLEYQNGITNTITKTFDNKVIAGKYADKAKRVFNAIHAYIL